MMPLVDMVPVLMMLVVPPAPFCTASAMPVRPIDRPVVPAMVPLLVTVWVLAEALPITTPEEMSKFLAERDLVISQRVARERERFADCESLKTKATEYDKAIEGAKTEQEKAV